MATTDHPIETLWVFVAEDHSVEPFTEGVVGYLFEIGRAQLITNRESLVPTLEKLAREIARTSGKTLRLVKFTRSEVLKTIPGGQG